MSTADLTWVWMDRQGNPHNGTTVSVCEKGVRGYSYYHRSVSGPWQLIAVAANEAESVNWFNHRVDPVDVSAELAAWLDSAVTR